MLNLNQTDQTATYFRPKKYGGPYSLGLGQNVNLYFYYKKFNLFKYWDFQKLYRSYEFGIILKDIYNILT